MNDLLPDEDVLTIPDSWRRSMHPRHGGAPGPAIKVDAKAVRAHMKRAGTAVEALRAGAHGDPALAETARRHLGGEADPAGAAAVAAVAALTVADRDAVHRAFTDAWTAEHGIGFAARALVELSRTAGVDGGLGDVREAGAVHREEDEIGVGEPVLRRVRSLLAAADDEAYAAAVRLLEGHRHGPGTRLVVAYLAPTRHDWVAEACAGGLPRSRYSDRNWLLLAMAGSAAHIAAANAGIHWRGATRGMLATVLDGLGTGALDLLLAAVGAHYLDSSDRRNIFEAVSLLPSDEAFQALLARRDDKHALPALRAAMKRFPVRALRLLASAGPGPLLDDHVRAHPEAVAEALPALPAGPRAIVEPVAAANVRLPDADPADVPRVLTESPWEPPVRPVVPGLRAPGGPVAVWRDGERERWRGTGTDLVDRPGAPDWETVVALYRRHERNTVSDLQIMVHGPEDLVRPLLAAWRGRPYAPDASWLFDLVARYEGDAFPAALRMAERDPKECAGFLMPFLDERVALLMGDWLAKGATAVRGVAGRWLERHGSDAVPFLVPAALGKAAKPRRSAESALRRLPCAREEVVAAARAAHGDAAADAVGEILAAHPGRTGLYPRPEIGDWADTAALPQPPMRGGERALPAAATRRLIELLTLPAPGGLDEVRDALEPGALTGFGWTLFQKWRDAGAPSKDGWALTQLGITGDDETVRRLTPVIRAWPGEGGHRNAVKGLGVLAGIGTDVALMHLNGIAEKAKFKGLKAEARDRIAEVADRLGLTAEQLADRLVPTFGLDDDGTRTLDYGPRRFTVRFDEQLRPTVEDESGRQRKTLPKPGAKDDPDRAPEAYKAFADLRKDVRTVAADQLRRFETAMVTGRRWTPDEFRDLIVGHPLVRHLARRLLWLAEQDGTTAFFRVAEDRTLADADDEVYPLPGTASVGVAHPVHLTPGERDAWGEVFADYEILQPFPQLGRPVHTLTEDERDAGRLERFEGLKVPFGKVLGLVRLGWERGVPQDAGGERWISRRVADDRYVVIDLHPGISVGAVDATGDHQTLEYVWFAARPGDFRPRNGAPYRFGDLDPVIASEVLADLTTLAAAAE
ncbi:DUF4132 domain-containing protein [Spirillospora albida]|uniref:DUF4132 domain-containing protein n=1 Tax=Spirillospora albida TaxID=58123 RepID=UPI0004C2AD31|nr:DUF4132 domain-containing protein [Spirillospora albida]